MAYNKLKNLAQQGGVSKTAAAVSVSDAIDQATWVSADGDSSYISVSIEGPSWEVEVRAKPYSCKGKKYFTVHKSYASGGAGPLGYDLAIELATIHGEGLVADRVSTISKEAVKVWDFYRQRRSDVTATPLIHPQSLSKSCPYNFFSGVWVENYGGPKGALGEKYWPLIKYLIWGGDTRESFNATDSLEQMKKEDPRVYQSFINFVTKSGVNFAFTKRPTNLNALKRAGKL